MDARGSVVVDVALVVAAVVLFVVIVVSSPAVQDVLVPDWLYAPAAAPAASRSPQPAPRRITENVTAAEYQQLRDGMSYRQAVEIIGFPGEELSRSSLAGTTTVMYQWMNPGLGGNMNAMFQDDRLVSKAQMGLR